MSDDTAESHLESESLPEGPPSSPRPDPDVDSRLFQHAEAAQLRLRENENNSLTSGTRTTRHQYDQIKVLQLWNSSTPLTSDKTTANGGGHFIIWKDKGIVIDPGFDFIKGFKEERHNIVDIDLIIVTHDHPDHCADFPALITLLKEGNEGRTAKHTIQLMLSYGAYFRYNHLFSNEEISRYTTVRKILPPTQYTLRDIPLSLTFTKTQHNEILGDSTGFGLRLAFLDGSRTACTVGITGDTGFNSYLVESFKGVDLLIAHIGTLENISECTLLDNHLGFQGIVELLTRQETPIPKVLVTEWGEELDGKRMVICDVLQRLVPSSKILPSDLYMKIRLPDFEVKPKGEDIWMTFDGISVSEDRGSFLRYKPTT